MKIYKFTQLTAISAADRCHIAASNDALLNLLVKKGVLTDTEAMVAAELEEENKGVTFSAKGNETVKLRFNGRMHFQYDSLDSEADGTDLSLNESLLLPSPSPWRQSDT